jgi:hypothetical protein
MSVFFSIFGFAVAVVGCGSEPPPPAGETIRQGNRDFFKTKTSQNKADSKTSGRTKKR